MQEFAFVSDSPRIEIYTQFGCPYCARAISLLQAKGVAYTEYDTTMDRARREEMVARKPGARTVPQIFIDDEAIGGSDDMAALDRAGKLDALLGL